MYKTFMLAVCGFATIHNSHAQDSLEGILQQVEQNNKELIALKAKVESERLALKSGNNLPDPQVGMFYLPYGDHDSGDYTEYQISQSFEFPSVYGARNQLIKTQSDQFELTYADRRQEILTETRMYCLELIYLSKQQEIEEARIAQSKMVLDQVEELFTKEQVGILELNKAKVAWMQDRFKVEHVKKDRENVLNILRSLNGGSEIRPSINEYVVSPDLPDIESLWNEKMANDPKLRQLKQQQSIAIQQLRLSKNKLLPNLTAGFNSQGVAGSRFSGIYAGLSIPLWSNRNTVKSAQSNLNYQEAYSEARTQIAFSGFEKEYKNYQHQLVKFQTYEETLGGLNSENLLLESYQLGEISFLQYYQEIQFYRQAFDTMLKMKHQLYQAQNELLKHQL